MNFNAHSIPEVVGTSVVVVAVGCGLLYGSARQLTTLCDVTRIQLLHYNAIRVELLNSIVGNIYCYCLHVFSIKWNLCKSLYFLRMTTLP